MRDKIAKNITKPLYLLQIAKDDVWEETWNIDLTESKPTDQRIDEYLNKREFKNVAIELCFKESKEKVYILGLVFNEGLLAKTPKEFLQIIVNEAFVYKDFNSLIANLDQKLIGKKYLLEETPDLIRIGIINHWFSVGPCLIWQKGEKKEISRQLLEEKLKTKPEVIKTNLNYQGLSFIFNSKNDSPGFRHWIKSPCSKYENGFWQLDQDIILHYLRDWQDFKST